MLLDNKKAASLTSEGGGDGQPPAGTRQWLLSCDESGTGGAAYYGFGVLVMDWNRRGDFQADIKKLRDEHQYYDEIKWNKVKAARAPFYLALIKYFFETGRLAFHCIIIRRADVDKLAHKGDWDLARRKHLAMFLTNKIKRQLGCHPGHKQTFRIWIDPIASRYKKADEALQIIGNHMVAAGGADFNLDRKNGPILGVHEHNSKETLQIQLCDLLLGATMDAWQQKAADAGKQAVKAAMAAYLDWPHLRFDTYPKARKFNIWYFKPPSKNREVSSRQTPWDS